MRLRRDLAPLLSPVTRELNLQAMSKFRVVRVEILNEGVRSGVFAKGGVRSYMFFFFLRPRGLRHDVAPLAFGSRS